MAASVVPTATIISNPASPLCELMATTFSVNSSTLGNNPTFQWIVNSPPPVSGATGQTWTTSTLIAGDAVSVIITSGLPCALPSTVTINYSGFIDFANYFPSVSITASPAITCENQFVVFSASTFDCGINPTFQWQVNGVNVGTNSPNFSYANLINGDIVSCIVTPDNTVCPFYLPPPATFPVTAAPNIAPSVSIAQNPPGSLCAGQSVTFTATPVNGGGAPTYQWYVNSTPVGGNSNTYTTTTLNNNDVVYVNMISSIACSQPKVSTAQITVAVTGPAPAGVTITQNPAGAFCFGIPVTFTANVTNGGATPTYQWYVNGAFTGVTTPTYSSSILNNNDVVRVDIVSSSACAIPNTATSQVVVAVNPSVTPTVSITANPPGSICQGTAVTFTANTTNGGLTPVINWYVGTTLVGTGASYSSSTLANSDVVKVEFVSSANCPVPDTVIDQLIMTVLPPVVPGVAISYVPTGTLCPGTSITFTATPTNGGAAPTYQWFVNGNPVGVGATYTTATLNNSDVVSVTMTSNDQCANPTTASDQVIITITPSVVPSVAITANPGTSICQGQSVTFIATPTNGGSSPSYQWQLNGSNITGATSSVYSTSTLNNNDQIAVVLVSSEPCPVPSSVTASITITVIPVVIPSVTIATNPGTTICLGTNVTFTANVVNGGATPSYQWYVAGSPVGTNSPTYSSTTLTNGQIVSVICSSSAACAIPISDTALVTMTVNSTVPSVAISQSPSGSVCEGSPITFTATPTNGGAGPTYQWLLGGNPIGGATGATYNSPALTNGATISVQMTSNANCPTPPQVTSNTINVSITTKVTPSVSITANPSGVICVGNSVTFTATPVNGGGAPKYQWYVNGAAVPGMTGSTFTSSTLQNGNSVTVRCTTSIACVTQTIDTSNAIVITTAQPLQVQVSPPVAVCPGDEVTLDAVASGGKPPYFYSWNNGAGSDSSVTVIAKKTTAYKVTVTDICGSTPVVGTVNVTVYPPADANFSYSPSNPSSLAPHVVFTDLSGNASSWQWDFGDTTFSTDQNPDHFYSYPGTFLVKLVVQSANGCLDSILYAIFVKDEIAFYVPNSFTPNGDGTNDLFFPIGYNVGPYNMTIFDRWGSVVYDGDEKKMWDGKHQDTSEPAPVGIYVYRIYLKDDKYDTPVVEGRVSLSR